MVEINVIMKYFDFRTYAVLSFFPLDLSTKILYPSSDMRTETYMTHKTFCHKKEKNVSKWPFWKVLSKEYSSYEFHIYHMFSVWLFSFEVNDTQKIVPSCVQVLYSKNSLYFGRGDPRLPDLSNRDSLETHWRNKEIKIFVFIFTQFSKRPL